MTPITDPAGEEGLRFFGRITASATHELKNALAIIKENAGLLNDYMAMAGQGRAVDPARLKTATGRIEAQVLRADSLLKALNHYAHSVDDHCKEIDLNDLLELFQTLLLRSAAMKQIDLEFRPAPSPVKVCTAPFLLLTALANCLSFALTLSACGEKIILQVSTAPAGAINFKLFQSFDEAFQMGFPDAGQSELLDRLDATLTVAPAEGRITIQLNRE